MRGSCHCGGVVYEAEPPLRDVVACHCTQCRKVSGHYWAASSVPVERFRLVKSETLRWFESSDAARRGFCEACSAALFWEPKPGHWPDDGGPTMHFAPGSLEGPTGLKIAAHIYKDDAGDYYSPEGPPPEPSRAAELHGSCLCGANSYTVPGPMGEAGACHCNQCRKITGHYSVSFAADEGAVRWHRRRDREYRTAAGGIRGHCPDCGSSLWFRAADGGFWMEAGAFDNPTGGRLTDHIFLAEAGDYYELDDGLPQWRIREQDGG